MNRYLWLAGVTVAFTFRCFAFNFYWQGVGGSGVGDYEVASNWTSNSVPAAADLVAFKNYGNQNWACTLNSDVTNTIILNDASTLNYQNLFNLNQHVWTATDNTSGQGLYVRWGTGGRVTFTNGTLRLVMLNCQSAPFPGSPLTSNHVIIAFQDIHSESANAFFAGSVTALDGGDHAVSNILRVGTMSGSSAYATLNLLNGTQVSVTNEVHIGETGGATGRLDVAGATLKMGKVANYFGYATGSKGTLAIGAGADVFSSGPVYVGNNGYGVVEQSAGTCVISNAFEVGVNAGSRGELVLQGGLLTVGDQRPTATNYFRVATNPGSTGEVTLAGGTFSYTGEACSVGRFGYGKLTVTGGTNYFANSFLLGTFVGGTGEMTVLGGVNTFTSGTGVRVQVGGYGRGSLLGLGGTNSVGNLAVANDAGSSGTMTVSNGLWTIAEHSWIGNSGNGTLTVNGGELRYLLSGSVLAIGRYGVATGEVTVAGGLVDMGSGGSVWIGRADAGSGTKSLGRLVLTGTGVLRAKQVFENFAGPGATSQLLFDGGTLKASASGAFVYSVDDVRLTANGMVVDSAGYNVSVATVLENASGQAGGITKKGAGTLTLAGTRSATGPVSVLGGTLVASNNLAVAAGTSHIDGTLTLTAANRLTVGAGAALAGTGTVARVTLQDNAVYARAKSDGAVTPLIVSDCVAEDHLTVALTGYSLLELITPVPLIRAPTAFIAPSNVTVTLNGQTNSFLRAKFVEAGGQQVLVVSYSTGTLITVM
jgi:autotransporter-associated beta strand protein/T5SS/PEP-CTERM-associated repeat protein